MIELEKLYKHLQCFAKNIKNERISRNLTQKQVAVAIGISAQSYQQYESGLALPSAENLIKLVLFFDVSLDDLFEL